MKIKKYRPNFVSGFEEVFFEVNSKEELLESELCKDLVTYGYKMSFSKEKEDYGFIMAIREEQNEEGAEWWVLAIIYNTQDVATLSEWLPDWNLKCKEYKNKSNK